MKAKPNKITSDGVQYLGEEFIGEDGNENVGLTATIDYDSPDTSFSYSYEDTQLDLFSEEDLRKKYPALKQAHEHYISVLEVCKTKEKEDNEN